MPPSTFFSSAGFNSIRSHVNSLVPGVLVISFTGALRFCAAQTLFVERSSPPQSMESSLIRPITSFANENW